MSFLFQTFVRAFDAAARARAIDAQASPSRRLKSRPATRHEQGFILLEILVALTAMTLTLAAFYQAISGSARAVSRVKLQAAAVSRAESHIDAVGSEGRLQPGIETGRYDDALSWRLEIVALPRQIAVTTEMPQAFWVVLDTFDRNGRLIVRLQTAKLARGRP